MNNPRDDTGAAFTTTPWDRRGIAAFEAAGTSARSAFESGLRAALTLALAPPPPTGDGGRSAPISGEGDDLASLFADMVEELMEHIEDFGYGLHDVVVDGVLRREGGGYIGWGYVSGTLEAASPAEVSYLLFAPTVVEDGQRIVIRAHLRRE